MRISRLGVVAGLVLGFAGTSAMACPDNLASGSNCVTEMETNQAGLPDSNKGGDQDRVERPKRASKPAPT